MSIPEITLVAGQDALASALAFGMTEPRMRLPFYRALLNATVYVPLGLQGPRGEVTLQEGEQASIMVWTRPVGSAVIPVFSSLELLVAAFANEMEETPGYLRIGSRELLEMTRGSHLCINPKSAVWKELVPPEVEELLALDSPLRVEAHLEAEGTRMLLGQLKEPPHKLIQALVAGLSRPNVKGVKRAFMAAVLRTDTDVGEQQPRVIVGLESEHPTDELIHAVAHSIADVEVEDVILDFMFITCGDKSLGDYLLTTAPIYPPHVHQAQGG